MGFVNKNWRLCFSGVHRRKWGQGRHGIMYWQCSALLNLCIFILWSFLCLMNIRWKLLKHSHQSISKFCLTWHWQLSKNEDHLTQIGKTGNRDLGNLNTWHNNFQRILYLFWWITNKLNQAFSSSFGLNIVTFLLRNIRYSLSSGMDPEMDVKYFKIGFLLGIKKWIVLHLNYVLLISKYFIFLLEMYVKSWIIICKSVCSSSLHDKCWAVKRTQRMSSCREYVPSKSEKCGIKIWVFYTKTVLKISIKTVFHYPFIVSAWYFWSNTHHKIHRKTLKGMR